ncbi:MAG: hypothetical protein ACRDYE_02215 [Acidimicrobiales bacterium]
MSTVDRRNTVPRPATAPSSTRPLPFWVLQITELVIAIVFVDVSVHVRGGGLLVAAAVACAALAVTADGPIGLLRICPPKLHITLAVAVAAIVAATPLVPALRPDIEGIIVLEFGAIGLIRVATLTRPSVSPRRTVRTRPRTRRVIDATASVVDPGAPGRPPPPTRSAGETGPPGEGAARRAGRTAGTAAASGKRLVAKHRPAAEAHLKRSIRNAGRWAARLAAPPDDRPSR